MHEAFKLLKEYDELKAQMRILEPKLRAAVTDYGVKEMKAWGLPIEKFRIHAEDMEKFSKAS